MRAYWDERARQNAAWYVDTDISYDDPDMDRFFETGRIVAAAAFDDAPVRPRRTELAVEIGAGLGRICLALADRFDRVVGVDISPEMVERARALVTAPNVTFAVGSGSTLDGVETATADLVVSFTVFQHIPDVSVIEDYIAEAGRVLRPGGVFAFQWNNTPGSRRWALRRAALAQLQRLGLWRERHDRHAAEFLGSRVPLTVIDRALRSGGLELVDTRDPGQLFTWAWARRA
jgi:SAM-dependent methyltransferase